jgi:hypothetical protein
MHSVYDNVAALPATAAVPLLNVAAVFGKPSIAHLFAAEAVSGASIDTFNYVTIMAQVIIGAPNAGTFTVDCKIQSSADGSGGWADVSGLAITQVTVASQVVPLRISDCMPLATAGVAINRYLRAVVTVTLAGGATGIPVSVILNGSRSSFDPINP